MPYSLFMVTTCLENLEMLGNLAAVREVLGKHIVTENCLLLTSHLGLPHQCLVICCRPCVPWCNNIAAYKVIVNILSIVHGIYSVQVALIYAQCR